MFQSAIVHFVNVLFHKLVSFYKNSKTAEMIASVDNRLKECLFGSVICRAVGSREKTSRYFEESSIFKIFQFVLDKFLFLLQKVFSHIGVVYGSNLAGRLLDKLFDNFVMIICLFIFVHTVIPYSNWHNQYGVILMAGISLLYLLKAARDRRYGLNIGRLDFAFVLYIAVVFFAAFTSLTPADSLKTFLFNIVLFLFVFVMVNSVVTREELGTIIYFIIASITVASLYGMWQYMNHIPVDPLLVDVNVGEATGRLYSTMGNPNNYAEYLIMTIPFYGAAFFNAKTNRVKAIIAALSLLPLVNLVLTSSRSSWIGFVVSLFVYVFLKNRRLIPVIICAGIAALPLIPGFMVDRMLTLGRDTSSTYRLDIWKGALGVLKDYWVTGVGIGPQPFIKLFRNYSSALVPAHSHMLPLQIWLELGVVGIGSFIWLVARLVKKGIISISAKKDEYLNNIIIANIASLAGIFTIGMVEYVWFYPRTLNMFWMDMGIFLIAINLSEGLTTADFRMMSQAERL